MSRTDTPAKERLLQTLLEAGPRGAPREQLVQMGGLSTASVYRVMRPLIEQGLVIERQGAYILPLELEHNFRYKLFHDMERLYELPAEIRNHILDLVDQIRGELKEQLLALWLVGSAAQGQLRPDSDIDFLAVVRKDNMWFPTSSLPVQFVAFTPRHFQEAFLEGDPFLVTALRTGLLLEDRQFAQRWLSRVPPHPGLREPDIWDRMHRRFQFMLEEKADEEARSLLKSLAVELTRAMLLSLGEVPSGKDEMLQLARLLLGEQVTQRIEEALRLPDLSRKELGCRVSQLIEIRDRWRSHQALWKATAALLHASGRKFEVLAQEIARTQFSAPYALECKSLKREVSVYQMHKAAQAMRGEPGRHILLVSEFREVPLLGRPREFRPEVQSRALELGLELWSPSQLLRARHEADLAAG